MRTFKPVFLITAVIAFVICMGSCTFSRTFDPEVKDNISAIADSINSQYHFEHINLSGKSTSGTSGKHTTLSIRFTNGQNLPTGNDKLQPLAKKLISQLLDGVKNEGQYDSFVAEFGTSKTDGSVTTNNYFDFDFTKEELKAK